MLKKDKKVIYSKLIAEVKGYKVVLSSVCCKEKRSYRIYFVPKQLTLLGLLLETLKC